jgi:hypothetical protein
MSGRLLSEAWGKLHFWSFFVGFNLTFFPQFLLGLSGMPRRIADYRGIDRWTPLNLMSTVGAVLTALSILPFVRNVAMSLRKGQVAGDDPWEGNSLEWATTSPPPHHNFHTSPRSTPNDPCSTSATAWTTARPATTPTRKPNPNAADHYRPPQAPVLGWPFPSGPGRTYSSDLLAPHVRKTADDIVSESRGVLAGPKRERGGRTMWPARNRSALAVRPRPGFPTDQQVLDGVPGADLAALLLNRGGQGPANTSVMAPVEGQFAARLGVTGSGEQPNGRTPSSARASAAEHGPNVLEPRARDASLHGGGRRSAVLPKVVLEPGPERLVRTPRRG